MVCYINSKYIILGLACCQFSFCTKKISQKQQKEYKIAKDHHQIGLNAAQNGDYVDSLAYLRSACRLKPNDTFYLNDLGVTEMRVGELHKAKKRFLQTLDIDPNQKLAQENLKLLKGFMKESYFEIPYKPHQNRTVSHTILQMNEVSPFHKTFHFQQHNATNHQKVVKMRHILESHCQSVTTSSSFHDCYDILKEPFIIRNALPAWGWTLNKSVKEFMKDILNKYGGEITDYYPHNMKVETVRPFRTFLNNSLPYLTRPPQEVYRHVDASEPGSYVQWNIGPETWNEILTSMNGSLPVILDETALWSEACFDTTKDVYDFHWNTHWKMMLAGEEGSGMFNHQDSLLTASYQFQLFGRKKW